MVDVALSLFLATLFNNWLPAGGHTFCQGARQFTGHVQLGVVCRQTGRFTHAFIFCRARRTVCQVLSPSAEVFLLQLFDQFSQEPEGYPARVLTEQGQAEVRDLPATWVCRAETSRENVFFLHECISVHIKPPRRV